MKIVRIAYILSWVGLLFQAAQGQNVNIIRQHEIGRITFSENVADTGLSGFFSGVHGDFMIIAGGSYKISENNNSNGKKVINDKIYLGLGIKEYIELKDVEAARLSEPIHNGAAVSVSSGLLCIGGETEEGISDRAFIISANHNGATIEDIPSLPFPLKFHSASVIGNTVYVAGGKSEDGISRHLLAIDLGNINQGWVLLTDIPAPIYGSSLVAQIDGEERALFLMGGMTFDEKEQENKPLATVYAYNINSGTWLSRGSINIQEEREEVPLSFMVAAPIGASHILVAGGYSGDGKKNTRILAYNTITDKWFVAGEWYGAVPVSTSANWWGGDLVIPLGYTGDGSRYSPVISITARSEHLFGWINYTVLALYFAGMLLLGFFFLRRNKTTEDFFKAGGRMPWWAAGISIFATTLSAITFIAIPAKAYAADWRMFIFNMCIILIAPVVIYYYLPFFRRFNLNTAYEYLELRFNRAVRWLASGLFISFMVSRIAIVLFLPSLALHTVTGFSIYWSIVIMGVVTIIYCTSGGIEAVVWGDVIQGFILVTGAILAFIFMIYGSDGGLPGFFQASMEYDKFYLADFRFDFTRTVFWVVVIGGLANSLILYTSDQSVVQRYMTTKNEKATGRSIWLNGIISIPVSLVFFLLGTGLFVFYSSNPERMAISNPNIDATFPQFIVGELPAGMSGILISAIFAAAMSTLSSNINSVAAVFTSDFYKMLARKVSHSRAMFTARISGVIVGLIGIVFALMLATLDITSLWDQFNTFLGLFTGGLAGLFIMGIFTRRISGAAALIGLIAGMAVLFFVQSFSALSFLLYGATGMTASLILALLASLFLPNRKNIEGYTYSTRISKID